MSIYLKLSIFFSTQSINRWKVLSALLKTLCPMFFSLLPKCFSVEPISLWRRVNISQVDRTLLKQRIGRLSEFFLPGNSCSVPRQTMRQSESRFQYSSRTEEYCSFISKVFKIFVDLSAFGIGDLTILSLVFNFACQIESNFIEDFFTF